MSISSSRNRQAEYARAKLRKTWIETHDGTIEKEAIEFLGDGAFQDTDTIDVTYDNTGPTISADVKDNSISNTKLRDSAATSVIGRAVNSSGDPADITATENGVVLRRTGDQLEFSELPASEVTYDNSSTVSIPLLVTNGDAETGDLTGWGSDPAGQWSATTDKPFSGSYSFLSSTSSSTLSLTVFPHISLPSSIYTYVDSGNATLSTSVYISTLSGTRTATLVMYAYSDADAFIGTIASSSNFTANTSFTEKTLTGTLPTNCRKISIQVIARSGSSNKLVFDSVTASIQIPGGLIADNIQDAIDEILSNSSKITYDPSESGLSSINIQDAIDELAEVPPGSGIDIEDTGSAVTTATTLNFIGGTITDQGSGVVDVEFSSTGSIALDDLTDVDTSGVTNGQILTYDSTSSIWVPETPSSSSYTLHGCLIRKSANQSLGNSVYVGLTFDTEEYDTDGFHSTSSNTERITIPSGFSKARFSGSCEFDPNANGFRVLHIVKNANAASGTGEFYGTGKSLIPATGSTTYVEVTTPWIDVTPGDYFVLQALQNTGSALNVVADFPTWFSCEAIP